MFSKYKSSKILTNKKNKHAGRNNTGRITVRHQGGGNKQKYRTILWKRSSCQHIVVAFEYDPNRTAFIAKLFSEQQPQYSYILAPKGLNILNILNCYNEYNKDIRLNTGDCSVLSNFIFGDFIHNVELTPNKGAKIARAAGTYCQVLEPFNKNFIKIRLPSNVQRLLPKTSKATLGVLSNEMHILKNIKKAGRSRWLNRRPAVRGVAMNPVDHPHGGGHGKTKGGRPSVTPWSKPTKGQPTRNKRKKNKLILLTKKIIENV